MAGQSSLSCSNRNWNSHQNCNSRYSTSPSLNSFSALIHNFYSSESSPSPAIHLTLDPESLSFTAYTASPIGTLAKPDHLLFTPIESVMRVHESERVGLDYLTRSLTETANTLPSPVANLTSLLRQVQNMLTSVIDYVEKVNAGKITPNEIIGRALLETIGTLPTPTATVTTETSTATGGKKTVEEDFNNHLADVLMVSYLANLVKTQTEISGRLNLLV